MNKLFGVHWYTEGDVKFVVSDQDIRFACDSFLLAEQKLVQEVEPRKVLKHIVVYKKDSAELVINVGDEYEVRGKVTVLEFPNVPVLLQDFVPTSLQSDAVTQQYKPRSASQMLRVNLVDEPSKVEKETNPLNLETSRSPFE